MTRVQLGRTDRRRVQAPARYSLSVGAMEELARRAGIRLPWPASSDRSRLAQALGDVATTEPTARPEADGDTAAELSGLDMLQGDRVSAGVAAALAGFAGANVFVDLSLGVRREAGTARLRSWQRRHDVGVTALTVSGPLVELAWWPVRQWAVELARTVTPVAPRVPGGAPPAGSLRMPYELLLASGVALREGRADVLAELVERHRGRVVGPDGAALTSASATEQVVRLHTGERGRLQVTVAGVADRRRRLGLVTWVLFADGWRELAPAPSPGDPLVEIRSVEPARLGGTVARMVAAVAS